MVTVRVFDGHPVGLPTKTLPAFSAGMGKVCDSCIKSRQDDSAQHHCEASMYRLILTIFAVTLLGGCASMSADECRTADWRTVGYEDGLKGSPGRLGDHRKACAKAGVTPDLDAYETGRADGLRQFCVPAKGYTLGSNGYSYKGVCPADLEPYFVEAVDEGRVMYRFKKAVSDLQSRINGIERDLDDDEDEIRDLERELVDDPGDASNRQRLINEIREKTRNSEAHRIELVQLSRDLYIAEQELEEYRQLQGDGYR